MRKLRGTKEQINTLVVAISGYAVVNETFNTSKAELGHDTREPYRIQYVPNACDLNSDRHLNLVSICL